MLSEAELVAKRAALRWLLQRHPEWAQQDLADALKMSRSWVSKWLRRLRQADSADVMALHSRSRARHCPPISIASQSAVVQRMLEMREAAPKNLQRIPGPATLLSFLHSDPELKKANGRLPRSQTTIWKILRENGCIEQKRRRRGLPLELRHPGEEVQFDRQPMRVVCLPIQKESGRMSSQWLMSSMPGPRSGCTAKCVAIAMPRSSSR